MAGRQNLQHGSYGRPYGMRLHFIARLNRSAEVAPGAAEDPQEGFFPGFRQVQTRAGVAAGQRIPPMDRSFRCRVAEDFQAGDFCQVNLKLAGFLRDRIEQVQ